MAESIYNTYDAGASGEECPMWHRANAANFWTAFAITLCGYIDQPFIKNAANNPYYPISDGAVLLLGIVPFAMAMLIDRRLFYSTATQGQFIIAGAIYLFASYASKYLFGVDYLESSIIPWFTIGMASIHLVNSISESREPLRQ